MDKTKPEKLVNGKTPRTFEQEMARAKMATGQIHSVLRKLPFERHVRSFAWRAEAAKTLISSMTWVVLSESREEGLQDLGGDLRVLWLLRHYAV